MARDPNEQLENENLHEDTDNETGNNILSEKDLENADSEDPCPEEQGEQTAQPATDPNLIEWDGPDDPENPLNWSKSKKWITTCVLGLMTFCVTFASSVFSNATVPTSLIYGVSTEVTTLGTSLFVLGFALGPLVSVFYVSSLGR
jgi:MFS transporter, DHA1 family, multidrug resistance protein